jgi:hypothetical protein
MGKSYIVACLALLACLQHKYQRITVVVPNNYLISRDKPDLLLYSQITKK